ncbi:MAG: tetratricopeptide repeat protein [Chitinivibrionales bacterium]|nr:tetratricopeptide repeat protein [Chitinivibrionales bacterium]
MSSQKDTEVQQLEQRLNENPQSLAFSRLADSYRKQGNIPQAIQLSVDGLEKHPWYATGRIILGRCYLEQENLQEAIQEFTHVCRLDRRNMVAIKMLADIFSKQGMDEKAGDLYGYLLKMDLENDSLAKLSANYTGSGKTDIFSIIGIEPQTSDQPETPVSPPSAEGAGHAGEVSEHHAESGAETAEPLFEPQEEQSYEQSVTEPSDDVEQLVPPADTGEIEVEETVDDLTAEIDNEISGSDIADRMDMVFNENGEAPAVEIEDSDQSPIIEESIEGPSGESEQQEKSFTPELTDAPISENLGNIPSSDDIASRVETMFGEETGPVVDESETPSLEQTPSQPAAPEPSQPETMNMPPAEDISGEDITSRIEEMFEEETAETNQNDVPSASPADTDTQKYPPQGEDDQLSPAAESTGTPAQADTGKPEQAAQEPESGIYSTPEPEEPAIETGRESDRDTSTQPAAETEQTGADTDIKGDDVTSRIDELFDEKPLNKSQLSDTTTVDLPETDQHGEGSEPPKETDTPYESDSTGTVEQEYGHPPPDEPSGGETDISGDDVTSRINEMFEDNAEDNIAQETNAPEKRLSDTSMQTAEPEGEENTKIEDASVSSADSDISGDDVTSRIEEMFEDTTEEPSADDNAPAENGNESVPGESTLIEEDTREPETQTPNYDTSSAEESIDKAITTENYLPDSIEDAQTIAIDRSAFDEAISEKAHRENQEGLATEDLNVSDEQAAVTGEDLTKRVDEMFSGSDSEEKTAVDNDSPGEMLTAGPTEEQVSDTPPVTDETVDSDTELFAEETADNTTAPQTEDSEQPRTEGSDSEEHIPEDFSTIGESLDESLNEIAVDLPTDIAGDDVSQRLEEMFPDDAGGQTAEDIIPDDESDAEEETEVGGGFYNISGENAENPAEDSSMLKDVDQVELDSSISEFDIPQDENADSDESTKETIALKSEDLEAAQNRQADEVEDTIIEEPSPEIEGSDIEKRLGELFPEESLDSGELAEAIPDDEDDSGDQVSGDFYTIEGENAGPQTTEQSLPEEIGNVEIEEEISEFSDDSGERELEEVSSSHEPPVSGKNRDTVPSNETETMDEVAPLEEPESKSGESHRYPAEETTDEMQEAIKISAEEFPPEEPEPENEGPPTIPDHVLTPTLADIYYQQGQAGLAVQIYSRLLERDPDNERIQNRLVEIKSTMTEEDNATGIRPQQPVPPNKEKKDAPQAKKKKSRRSTKKAVGDKPLKGVRIKRKIRENLKKGRPKSR